MNVTPNVLLLTATIADICITLFGLGVGCFETNPIVDSVGWVGMLLGKLVATLNRPATKGCVTPCYKVIYRAHISRTVPSRHRALINFGWQLSSRLAKRRTYG